LTEHEGASLLNIESSTFPCPYNQNNISTLHTKKSYDGTLFLILIPGKKRKNHKYSEAFSWRH